MTHNEQAKNQQRLIHRLIADAPFDHGKQRLFYQHVARLPAYYTKDNRLTLWTFRDLHQESNSKKDSTLYILQ